MYTVKVFGKKREVSKSQFFIALAFILAYIITSTIGLYRIGGLGLLFGLLMLLSSATMSDGKTYTVIKNDKIREFLGSAVGIVGFGYFIYTSFF